MKSNQAKPNGTSVFRIRSRVFDFLLTLFLLLPKVLLTDAARAAELRGVLDQGFLNLSWEVPDAKLEEAPSLAGPWQTVIAANSPYRLGPSSLITNRCRFYRLKMPPPGKKWLTVAAVTMTSQTNTEANLQTFYSYMERAASNHVDLIAFPEVALQGCPAWREDHVRPSAQEMAYTRQTAEMVPGPSTSNLVAKAKELNLFVVVGMAEKDAAGKLYNAAVFLGPTGVLGTHRKAILAGNEDLIFSQGTQLIQVFDSPLGRAGLIICAELGGEAGTASTVPGPPLAAQGAQFLITASAWWNSIADLWDPATVENARQSKRWHVVSNQVGASGRDPQCIGHGRVVDPLGRIVCDTGAKEGLVVWPTDILIDAGR